MKSRKELFEQTTGKQLRAAKKILLLVYGIIGVVFLILALILFLLDVRDPENGILIASIFAPIGGFFLLVGIILYAVMPRKMNYEKYEKRCEKYGVQNLYAISAELSLLREQVKELEEKITALERR